MTSEAAYFPDALPRREELSTVASDSLGTAAPPLAVHSAQEAPDAVRTPATISDEALMERVRAGDREALGHLFRRHARAVRGIACRVLRDQAEADDLVQEVFLFLVHKARLFDPRKGSAVTWIMHVAYHRAFDRRRYLNTRNFYRNQELDDAVGGEREAGASSTLPVQSIEATLGKATMARIRSRLSPEQLETIELYFFEGYALKEIAALTGRSLVNVRSHYYRGLERLRTLVLPGTEQFL